MGTFIQQEIIAAILTPAHLITALGLGLLLGQQAQLAKTIPAFIVSMAIGSLLTLWVEFPWEVANFLLPLALLMGVLLAWRPSIPSPVLWLFAVYCGVFIALGAAPSIIPGLKDIHIYSIMAGSTLISSLSVVLMSGLAYALRHAFEGLILRILGSWIAASALMVMTLTFLSIELN